MSRSFICSLCSSLRARQYRWSSLWPSTASLNFRSFDRLGSSFLALFLRAELLITSVSAHASIYVLYETAIFAWSSCIEGSVDHVVLCFLMFVLLLAVQLLNLLHLRGLVDVFVCNHLRLLLDLGHRLLQSLLLTSLRLLHLLWRPSIVFLDCLLFESNLLLGWL